MNSGLVGKVMGGLLVTKVKSKEYLGTGYRRSVPCVRHACVRAYMCGNYLGVSKKPSLTPDNNGRGQCLNAHISEAAQG